MPGVTRLRMPVHRFRPGLGPTATWGDPRGACQGALLEQQNWAIWHDECKDTKPPAAPMLLGCKKALRVEQHAQGRPCTAKELTAR